MGRGLRGRDTKMAERSGEATSPHPLHRIGTTHVPDSSSVKPLFFRYCKDGTLKSLETCLRSGIVPVDVLDQVRLGRARGIYRQQGAVRCTSTYTQGPRRYKLA